MQDGSFTPTLPLTSTSIDASFGITELDSWNDEKQEENPDVVSIRNLLGHVARLQGTLVVTQTSGSTVHIVFRYAVAGLSSHEIEFGGAVHTKHRLGRSLIGEIVMIEPERSSAIFVLRTE